NGAVITVLTTHGHAYVKLSPAFLRIAHPPATACSRLCGKYLVVRAHGQFIHLNMAALTYDLTRAPASGVKLLGAVTIGGQRPWLRQDPHKDSPYVAAHGKPYVLRAVGPPPGQGTADLTQQPGRRIIDGPRPAFLEGTDPFR